jgi:hypothetical protein
VSLTDYDSATCPASSFTLSATLSVRMDRCLVHFERDARTRRQRPNHAHHQCCRQSATPGSYSSPIAAADITGRHAAASDTASYTVEFVDTVPPTAPERLAARQRQSEIQLSWNAATDNVGVTGYKVLRNGAGRRHDVNYQLVRFQRDYWYDLHVRSHRV